MFPLNRMETSGQVIDVLACIFAVEGDKRGGADTPDVALDVLSYGLGRPDQIILECDPGSGFKLD